MGEWVISSSALIIIVLLIRHFFKKIVSGTVRYGIWMVVLLRLLIPFSLFPSNASVNNLVNDSVTNYEDAKGNNLWTPMDFTSIVRDRIQSDNNTVQVTEETEKMTATDKLTIVEVIRIVWITGCIVMAVYLISKNLIFYSKLRNSRRLHEKRGHIRVYIIKENISPCLFGVIRPAIYINQNCFENNRYEHIILHEETHLKHHDNIWGAFRCICLIIHWFNPFVWIAATLSIQDAELACDEAVIKKLGENNRFSYGDTLIDMESDKILSGSVIYNATGMKSGKNSMKERITYIANKPTMVKGTLICLLIALCGVALLTFSSKTDNQNSENDQTTSSEEPTTVENQTTIAETTDINANQDDSMLIYESFINDWIEAFCSRDTEALISYCSDNYKEEFASLDYIKQCQDPSVTVWVQESLVNIAYSAPVVYIEYYIVTDEPHVWCWYQTIYVKSERNGYKIYNSELIKMDNIETQEYAQMYSNGSARYVQYMKNGLAYYVNMAATAEGHDEKYDKWLTPDTAAKYQLNLGDVDIEIASQGSLYALLTCTYKDGFVQYVYMIQPFGSNSIWVVDDISTGKFFNNYISQEEWYDSLTIDDLSSVTDYLEEDYKADDNIYLLLEDKEENAALYYYNSYNAVRINDKFMSPYWNCSLYDDTQMDAYDYDGDGSTEVAVKFSLGSGTGLHTEELHIIDTNSEGELYNRSYSEASLLADANKAVTSKYDEDTNSLQWFINGEAVGDAIVLKSGVGFIKTLIQNIYSFSIVDNKITFDFHPAVVYSQGYAYDYTNMPKFTADVIYDGTDFRLDNFSIYTVQ